MPMGGCGWYLLHGAVGVLKHILMVGSAAAGWICRAPSKQHDLGQITPSYSSQLRKEPLQHYPL